MDKFVCATIVLAAAFAAVSSAPAPQLYYAQQPAIASTSSNVLRTPGNLGQISTYTKAIDTPTSSVRKSDVRISNDALAYPVAYHAPVATAYQAAPVAYHAPVATAYQAAPVAYHAPIAAAAPVAYHAPVGVSYSPATAVSHITFDGSGGIHYAY